MKSVHRWVAFVMAMAALFVLTVGAQPRDYQADHVLTIGERIVRPIAKDEKHVYLVKLKRGDLLHIKIVQRGLNVLAGLARDADRRKVLKTVDDATGATGVENFIYLSPADDTYAFGVFAGSSETSGSSYILQNTAPFATRAEKLAGAAVLDSAATSAYNAENLELAIELHRRAIEMLRPLPPSTEIASLYVDLGNDLYKAQEYSEALLWYRRAQPVFQRLKDDGNVAITLLNAGNSLFLLKKYPEAIRAYQQALPILKNDDDISTALISIGQSHELLLDREAAIASFEKALPVVRALDQPQEEGALVTRIASTLFAMGAHEKAAERFKQALAIYEKEKDLENQALILSNIGLTYATMERIDHAHTYLATALKLVAESNSPRVEGVIRQVLGEAYFAAGRIPDALAQFELSLKCVQKAGDPSLEIVSIRGIASAKVDLGDFQAALSDGLAALKIAETIKDDAARAGQFGSIAHVYSEMGKYDLSFAYNLRALALYRQLKDRYGERIILNNIGIAYLRIGSLQKAEEYIRQTAVLARELKNEREMAMTLGNLGAVYARLKQYDKAIPYFEEALPLFKKYNNHRFWVIIGYYYGTLRRERGELDQAIKLHTEAVELARVARTPKYEARALIELGLDRLAQRNPSLASAHFHDALITARTVRSRDEEAAALAGLMQAEGQNRNYSLAIFFGKQSINLLQATRGEIDKYEKGLQDNYLKDNEPTYRQLADTLISEGRLPEAQQVLGMLKEEELSGFVRRDSKELENLSKRSDLRATERSALEKYSSISSRVTGLAAELAKLDDMRRSLKDGEVFADQARYEDLSAQIKTANAAFRIFLEKELASELGTAKKLEIDADRALQGKLKQWGEGTVAVATMVGVDRYRVILTTPNVQIDGKSEISSADLNRKIFAFREALLDPSVNPKPLGKELYDILLKPIEKDLAASGAKTLLWSLDGTLRYIPIAALWDGERYLVEKFQNVIVTSTTRQSLQSNVVGQWNVLGAGVTKASQVTDAATAQKITFDELLGVGKELTAIIGSPQAARDEQPRGFALLDAAFTERALKQQLTQTIANKRRYNVLHFATHFRLGTDTSDSFLLLGNNAALTLADVADSPEMDLTDIELVTLSACNTGYGGIEANKTLAKNNGKEVDSLAQFIELRGAKSVMATLWAVVDESTALLMGDFYRLREANPIWTKAEALRKAQLALLSGEKKGVPIVRKRRSDPIAMDDSEPKQPAFVKDPLKPFAHPHYWAPFVMIGNWR